MVCLGFWVFWGVEFWVFWGGILLNLSVMDFFGVWLWGFAGMSKSKKIEAKIQIFYQICMNFQHFGMKFACKGVAVLIFEA